MRLVVLMIPIALVGGYVVHSLSTHDHRTVHAVPTAPPAPAAAPVAPVPLAPAIAPAAPPALPQLAQLDAAFDTDFDGGVLRIRGAAGADLVAAVEGALQLASRRLADGDSLDAERVAELVTWSASLLANVAADLEGYLEIETPDGERVVINAAGRPSVRIESQ